MNIDVWWWTIPCITLLITLGSLGVMAFLKQKYGNTCRARKFREKAQFVIIGFNLLSLDMVWVIDRNWATFLCIAGSVLIFALCCHFVLSSKEDYPIYFVEMIALAFFGTLIVVIGGGAIIAVNTERITLPAEEEIITYQIVPAIVNGYDSVEENNL